MSSENAPAAGQHYYAIDLLRFFAALSVLVFHIGVFGPFDASLHLTLRPFHFWESYGKMGVSLFFLISGFVIALSAQGRTAAQFVWARALRLYPAFWVCCTLSTVAMLLFAGPAAHVTAARYFANMTLFAPWFGAESIDRVYWSLYAEIRFYAFVAVIVGIGGLPRLDRFMAAWLAVSAFNFLVPLPPVAGLFVLDFCPLFVAGTVFADIARRAARPWHYALLLAAFAVNAAYDVRSVHYAAFPAVASVIILLSFYIVMFAVARGWLRLPKSNALILLGALSYPVYLLHREIGLDILFAIRPFVPPHLVFVPVVGTILLLAYAVVRFVERPVFARLKSRGPRFTAPQGGETGALPGTGAASIRPQLFPGSPRMPVERTLSIIKPDATRRNVTGAIIDRFEKAGLRVVAQRRTMLSVAQAEAFYGVHKERPFFKSLVEFMTSGPVVVQVLEGENAVAKNREVMGATNPANAAAGTIRKDFAESIEANSVHGSDAPETAANEIRFFFCDLDIVG